MVLVTYIASLMDVLRRPPLSVVALDPQVSHGDVALVTMSDVWVSDS